MKREVIVVLPCHEGKVLMQLRDLKPDIVLPGCWGFFSGSTLAGEEPETAALRELYEELRYEPKALHYLGREVISDLDDLVSYCYCCPLDVPLDCLTLSEGLDLGLFTPAQVASRTLYSSRMGKSFPVIDSLFIMKIISKALASMASQYEQHL